MRKFYYEVTFLSDIVLPASSNTQGNIEYLDFIAGSVFLGIVASNYKYFENKFDIFHSAKVRFGDATPLHNGKRTYKTPLSFFHEKLKKETLYNYHLINDFSKFDQLKQKRDAYITEDLESVNIEYNYTQKSAYDRKNRRSKESQMYGYVSMKKGSSWQFCISCDDAISQKDLLLLQKSIVGQKRLGKSKSSQYGLAEIQEISTIKTPSLRKTQEEVYIYVNSRLALVDAEGNPTLDVNYLFDGLRAASIVDAKTQLKTSTFTPYNSKRKTKDYERVCINKGSVIVLKNIDIAKIPEVVGAYQSEGFGELLVNPSFLFENGFELQERSSKTHLFEKVKVKSSFVKILQDKRYQKETQLDLIQQVDDFVLTHYEEVFKNITHSQWGTLRSICKSKAMKEDIQRYISKGEKAWKKKQIDILLEHNTEFISLVAVQMPKHKSFMEQGGKND